MNDQKDPDHDKGLEEFNEDASIVEQIKGALKSAIDEIREDYLDKPKLFDDAFREVAEGEIGVGIPKPDDDPPSPENSLP